MIHLRPDEFVDLAEGARAEGDTPHLAVCGACRQQLADARAALEAAASGIAEVPEPPAVFWDALSARVREAVDAERAPGRIGAWLRPDLWRWAMPAPLAAAAVALIVAGALGRYGLMPTAPERGVPSGSEATAGIEPGADLGTLQLPDAADDPTLGLVADLVTDLDLDRVAESGLTVPVHALGTDDFLEALTSSERLELQRLLQEEIAKS